MKHPRKRKEARLRQPQGNAATSESSQPGANVSGTFLWLVLGLCAINLAIYSGVIHHDFIDLDDAAYVYQNPHVSSGLTWPSVIWAFRTFYQDYWHPLTWLSHMLDVQLFGMNAGGHHAVSLLFHMLNTLLLFGALNQMTGARYRSAFAAALFAAHPLHVESVAWAAERKDVLSAFFWISAIWAYGWYARKPDKTKYMAVAVLFLSGLMSKPMVVTLPFTLLLLDYWPLERVRALGGMRAAGAKLILEKIPLFALALVVSAITFIAQRQAGAVTGTQVLGPATRVAHAITAYAVYLGKTVWPSGLAPFYHYNLSVPMIAVLGSAALLIGISSAVWRAGRERPYLAVGWLWFLGTLVPSIGLVQVGLQAWADRYTYVPMIGLAVIVSWGGLDLLNHWAVAKFAPAAATGVLVVLGLLAYVQNKYWQDAYTIWSHALEVTGDNQIAENGVGTALYLRGSIDAAIPHLVAAIRIQPDYVEARLTLALALVRQGRVDDAIAQDRIAIGIRPNVAVAHGNLGLALLRAGQTDKAREEFNTALRLDPSNRDAHDGLNYLARIRK